MLEAPDYWLGRLVIQRGLALLYLIAFINALNQFRPLLGERGLLPVPRFLQTISHVREAPSIFYFHYSDRFLAGTAWIGVALSTAALTGVSEMGPVWLSVATWFCLWALYLSIVNVGQTWYSFGWESLLLEAGFLAIFLGPRDTTPPLLVLLLFWWLVFRLELGAGLIKMRGDPCWRNLTCLYFHHETQPMPNPLSWHFHHLPRPLHRVEAAANHFAQLVVPFGLFLPQPIASAAALIIIVTQSWLIISGNFSWLNAITIVLAFSGLDDSLLGHAIPLDKPATMSSSILEYASLALFVVIVVLSYQPARNLISPGQLMNFSFNKFHLVNTYGAFGTVTRVRYEIVIEGTHAQVPIDAVEWRAYEFKGKPGDPKRRPPQIAPYHLRLDWLMWFAALSPAYADPWFVRFAVKLIQNDESTLRLLANNPFPESAPTYVRARLFRYRFTNRAERKLDGTWWHRELVGEYLPPTKLP